jgi:Tfp pilus assembly protein PilO
MASAEHEPGRTERWRSWLRDPFRLRLGLTGVVLLAGYLGIYWPLSGQIQDIESRRIADSKRLALARDIEQLRVRYDSVADRLPTKGDAQELMHYLLEKGIRGRALRPVQIKLETSAVLGPYHAVSVSLDLEGTFHSLCEFLRWLETNERLLRVDAVRIAVRPSGALGMTLTVVGLMN